MVKAYRAIQQWNHWLARPPGERLLNAEQTFLPHFLADCFGKYALLIGVSQQYSLLKFNTIPEQVLLSPLTIKAQHFCHIEGNFDELPIASASIDLVLLPHAMELVDNPYQVLTEACRVVKPEGHIIILGFNPYSLWGLKKWQMKQPILPWSLNAITANQVKDWLALRDFELVKQSTFLFRPMLQHHEKLYNKLRVVEWLGSKIFPPFGCIYALMAKAKVIPLTPIKLHWKQELTGVQATIPGPTIRNSE